MSRDLDVYYAEARRQIERFGGVVEKFVGDAVVGEWGAPVGREDDPRRAALAALGIVNAVWASVESASTPARPSSRSTPGPSSERHSSPAMW